MIAVRLDIEPTDERFVCFRDGWLEYLTIDQIKAAIAAGERVEEWKSSASS